MSKTRRGFDLNVRRGGTVLRLGETGGVGNPMIGLQELGQRQGVSNSCEMEWHDRHTMRHDLKSLPGPSRNF